MLDPGNDGKYGFKVFYGTDAAAPADGDPLVIAQLRPGHMHLRVYCGWYNRGIFVEGEGLLSEVSTAGDHRVGRAQVLVELRRPFDPFPFFVARTGVL